MQISCPNCDTTFSVPDKALGAKGRTMKCAKCGHKWFQPSPQAEEEEFAPDETSFPPLPAQPPLREEEDVRPSFGGFGGGASASSDDSFLDEPPIPNLGLRATSDDMPNHMGLDAPQPVPDIFSSSSEPPRKGTGGLWALLILLLLGGLGGGIYYLQDKVVDLWPPAHDLLNDIGLRHEKLGAGLELRNAGTPERFVHNDVEVLIVRGIIANVSDRERPVPTMKLVLLNKEKQQVQEKQSQPPVSSLAPGGTAGFRIILERPEPNAVEVNVLFVERAAEAK